MVRARPPLSRGAQSLDPPSSWGTCGRSFRKNGDDVNADDPFTTGAGASRRRLHADGTASSGTLAQWTLAERTQRIARRHARFFARTDFSRAPCEFLTPLG
jgi:hypothetical protein